MITVTIWHNAARDGEGRPTGMLDGYRPRDQVVRVFAYQADPAGRALEEIAEEAFAICNGHPRDAHGADLARRYYERELRSLSFPGKQACCGWSCCWTSAFVLCPGTWWVCPCLFLARGPPGCWRAAATGGRRAAVAAGRSRAMDLA